MVISLICCKKKIYDNAEQGSNAKQQDNTNFRDKVKKHDDTNVYGSNPEEYNYDAGTATQGKKSKDYIKENEVAMRDRKKAWKIAYDVLSSNYFKDGADITKILDAWMLVLELSSNDLKFIRETKEKAKNVWSTQQKDRENLDKAVSGFKNAKKEWKKSKAENAQKAMEKAKEEKHKAQNIAKESLESLQELEDLIDDKTRRYNHKVKKFNKAVGSLMERDENSLAKLEKEVNEAEKDWNEAKEQRDEAKKAVDNAKVVVNETTNLIIKAEETVLVARVNYHDEFQKFKETEVRMKAIDTFKEIKKL